MNKGVGIVRAGGGVGRGGQRRKNWDNCNRINNNKNKMLVIVQGM